MRDIKTLHQCYASETGKDGRRHRDLMEDPCKIYDQINFEGKTLSRITKEITESQKRKLCLRCSRVMPIRPHLSQRANVLTPERRTCLI